MKVVSPQQMSDLESQAYQNGASESDFMEEAGSGVALIVYDYVERNGLDHVAILLCGKGNNGGDAYATGIQLLNLDFEVFAVQPISLNECSPLCRQNYERFVHKGGHILETINKAPKTGIIIDGIFGTGYHGIVQEPYLNIIQAANRSQMPIISIDIPSGLNGDSGLIEGEAIIATETVFLSLPKRGFFFNEGWDHVGKLRYVDFGLPQEPINALETSVEMLSEDLMQPILPPIKRNRHKYQAGYVVGIAGSSEMPGAAILAATSALRGGAGIVRLFYPKGMEKELNSAPYELICTGYQLEKLSEMFEHLNRASAVFIGPGLGRSTEIDILLKKVLPEINCPCVIDADALNFLAEQEIQLPPQTVLTPHHGEMVKLLKKNKKTVLNEEFIKHCLDYAISKKVTLVLKGGPTFILEKDHPIFVNPTGDPGMATAGSGDVLTGLIAAMLAQGLKPNNAASLSVYLHGLAGEHAAEDMTSYCMCATDIIYRYPEAFKFLPV